MKWIKSFTLVELLVAVCILSAISLSLGGVLFSGMKLWRRTENAVFFRKDVLLGLERLCRQLRQHARVPDIDFAGDSGRMEFSTLAKNSISKMVYEFGASSGQFSYRKIRYQDVLSKNDNENDKKNLFSAG